MEKKLQKEEGAPSNKEERAIREVFRQSVAGIELHCRPVGPLQRMLGSEGLMRPDAHVSKAP